MGRGSSVGLPQGDLRWHVVHRRDVALVVFAGWLVGKSLVRDLGGKVVALKVAGRRPQQRLRFRQAITPWRLRDRRRDHL